MALHPYHGVAGYTLATPSHNPPNTSTSHMTNLFTDNSTEHIPGYDLAQVRQQIKYHNAHDDFQRTEYGTYSANDINGGITKHQRDNSSDLASNQNGILRCKFCNQKGNTVNASDFSLGEIPRFSQRHRWDSTLYPDPTSGYNSVLYYGKTNRNMPMGDMTQHAHRRSSLPSVVPPVNLDMMPKLSNEDFQEWDGHLFPTLGSYQADSTRAIDQLNVPASSLKHIAAHLSEPSQLDGFHFGGYVDQAKKYESSVLKLESYNSSLPFTRTQTDVQPENHHSSGPNENGYIPHILDEEGYLAKVAARFKRDIPSDYPQYSQPAQLEIIRKLFEAFRNTKDIIDKPQVGQSFKDGSIPDEEIEMVCWELMLAARASQVHPLVARYHDCKYAKCTSFTQRIELTIKVCKEAKSVCRMLLAPNFAHRVVDNPLAELQRKRCNIRLNEKKTGQNKAGQKAIKERYAREDGEWLKKDEAKRQEEWIEDVEGSRPLSKRLRPN